MTIYLDHNATTPTHPDVVEAMLPWLHDGYANPSSDHAGGRRARAAIDLAREQVAALVNAVPEAVVFTSGGTESDNLAILGSVGARPDRRHILTSTVEHPAVAEPCRHLEGLGHPMTWLEVGPGGAISADQAEQALSTDTVLISVMLANNETGALQPIRELAAAGKRVGATIHTDAAQAVGKMAVDMEALGVDLLTIAGHKLYAPKGIGALVVRPGTPLQPVLRGAGHEGGLRPGTENVPSIVGLGHACALAARGLHDEAHRQRQLVSRLWDHLHDAIGGLRRTVSAEEALPNTLHVRLPGCIGANVLARTPAVAASTGSACHAGVHAPSPVLLAMGLAPDDALGALRLSVGRSTTSDDVDRAAEALVASFRQEAGSARSQPS